MKKIICALLFCSISTALIAAGMPASFSFGGRTFTDPTVSEEGVWTYSAPHATFIIQQQAPYIPELQAEDFTYRFRQGRPRKEYCASDDIILQGDYFKDTIASLTMIRITKQAIFALTVYDRPSVNQVLSQQSKYRTALCNFHL